MTPEMKLRRLVAGLEGSTSALMAADIRKLRVDESLLGALEESFASDRREDLSLGFLFLNVLLEENRPSAFPTKFYESLIPRVRVLLRHESSYVRSRALELFVWLRKNYPDYKAVMMEHLRSDDLGARKVALANYETYADPKEISPLVEFSSDGYAADYAMNSPMFYELRDAALQKISGISGVNFCGSRLNESHEGTTVSWYDWSDFYKWWDLNKALYL